MSLSLCPVTLAEANAFVRLHHRHHGNVVGHKFSLGAVKGGNLVGIAIVGRPVARMRDDGYTLEVTRLCTDGTKNACSFLYGGAARAAFALGYKRLGTYILASENGASLRASGWRLLGKAGGGSWSRPARPRLDKAPTEQKQLFEITASYPAAHSTSGHAVSHAVCESSAVLRQLDQSPHDPEAGQRGAVQLGAPAPDQGEG